MRCGLGRGNRVAGETNMRCSPLPADLPKISAPAAPLAEKTHSDAERQGQRWSHVARLLACRAKREQEA